MRTLFCIQTRIFLGSHTWTVRCRINTWIHVQKFCCCPAKGFQILINYKSNPTLLYLIKIIGSSWLFCAPLLWQDSWNCIGERCCLKTFSKWGNFSYLKSVSILMSTNFKPGTTICTAFAVWSLVFEGIHLHVRVRKVYFLCMQQQTKSALS